MHCYPNTQSVETENSDSRVGGQKSLIFIGVHACTKGAIITKDAPSIKIFSMQKIYQKCNFSKHFLPRSTIFQSFFNFIEMKAKERHQEMIIKKVATGRQLHWKQLNLYCKQVRYCLHTVAAGSTGVSKSICWNRGYILLCLIKFRLTEICLLTRFSK